MEFQDVVRRRRMVRTFDGRPLPPEVVERILADEGAYRRRYAEPDKARSGLADGPWPVPYWHVDAGFAALLMLLTAVDAGLGELFFGVSDHDGVRRTFGVPD